MEKEDIPPLVGGMNGAATVQCILETRDIKAAMSSVCVPKQRC